MTTPTREDLLSGRERATQEHSQFVQEADRLRARIAELETERRTAKDDADQLVHERERLRVRVAALEAAWREVPKQYMRERWELDYDERRSVFFVHSGGHRILDCEDSEVAHAVCEAFNQSITATCVVCGEPAIGPCKATEGFHRT